MSFFYVDPLDDDDICPGEDGCGARAATISVNGGMSYREDGCGVGAVTMSLSGDMNYVRSCLLLSEIGEVFGERLCDLLSGWLVGRVVR